MWTKQRTAQHVFFDHFFAFLASLRQNAKHLFIKILRKSNMEPRIETLTEKKLVGMHTTMSMADNQTRQLWQRFMPRRNEIANRIGSEFYSMQLFDFSSFANFTPNTHFEKWAAVEVANFENIPAEMASFTLPGGLYVVFFHKGAAATAPQTFQYIFGVWLPNSKYLLDDRPHFEVLGEKYQNDHPDSEEEIWIPVK